MSRKERVELVCDVCSRGSESPGVLVTTRRVAVDGVEVEAEVCEEDWAGLMATFAVFATHGRRVPSRTRIVGAKGFPGTSWKFTGHAMIRLGERKIDPLEIVKVLDSPLVTRPGNASDLEIREGRSLKAVVAPERGIVITVARIDERIE